MNVQLEVIRPHGAGQWGLAAARVTGVAAALIDDAEARLAEKRGGTRARTVVSRLETPDGVFEVEAWRYEKVVWL
jgi:hypothetical protein